MLARLHHTKYCVQPLQCAVLGEIIIHGPDMKLTTGISGARVVRDLGSTERRADQLDSRRPEGVPRRLGNMKQTIANTPASHPTPPPLLAPSYSTATPASITSIASTTSTASTAQSRTSLKPRRVADFGWSSTTEVLRSILRLISQAALLVVLREHVRSAVALIG